MQIALAQPSKDTFLTVLADFQSEFSLKCAEVNYKFSYEVSAAESLMCSYNIKELKCMTDFIASRFNLNIPFPKRNSRASLAVWVAKILLNVRELVDVEMTACSQKREEKMAFFKATAPTQSNEDLEAMAAQPLEASVVLADFPPDINPAHNVEVALFAEPLAQYTSSEVECPQCRHTELFIAQNNLCNVIRCRHCTYAVPKTYLGPIKFFATIADQITNSPCPNCGFIHGPFQNTLCDYGNPSPKVEVLEPEIYTISIVAADYSFSEKRVNRLPPYLLNRQGKLLKKFWHRNCDAGYAEIVSEHLSHITVESGLVIRLMAENLEVSQACIFGDPPPFLIHAGGVYKRDRVKLSLAPRYFQVVSEYLSNIVVV